jgi:hypothetical protein
MSIEVSSFVFWIVGVAMGWLLSNFIEVEVRFRGRPSKTVSIAVEAKSENLKQQDLLKSSGDSNRIGSDGPKPIYGSKKSEFRERRKFAQSWIQWQQRLGNTYRCCHCGRLTAPGDRFHNCGKFAIATSTRKSGKSCKEMPKAAVEVVNRGVQAKAIWKWGEAQTDWSDKLTDDEFERRQDLWLDEAKEILAKSRQFRGE